ncbi:Mov34/MPN/PAD-1 family protein [Pseudomonas syringae]|uniref:Mov34/MPN/PAD-1 family protein n=1 Tax=Pseudomonas syringae TaxID=317 RepID=UPI000E3107F6|nr:Mov34/MPN/PAD-1 family protein [Pseudomonas syringae]
MHFLSEWAANEGRNLIYFQPQVLETFKSYIQVEPNDLEAGGLLLGYVRGSHLEIIEATVPTKFDKRLRYFFERMQELHDAIAHKRWVQSDGKIRYLGEWHTHPENYPSPSGIDLREWHVLAAKRKDGRPVLGVIVGRHGLYVENTPRLGRAVRYEPIQRN